MQVSVACRCDLPLALASLLLLSGCGDSPPAQEEAPKRTRRCGELDGVEPVEPTVLGGDEFGCPIIEPVPCTRPRHEHEWACGSDCKTATAFRSDGDEWVLGCVGGSLNLPDGGADPEPDPPPLCLLDPIDGERWVFNIDCDLGNFLFAARLCWPPCNTYTEEALEMFCPRDE